MLVMFIWNNRRFCYTNIGFMFWKGEVYAKNESHF